MNRNQIRAMDLCDYLKQRGSTSGIEYGTRDGCATEVFLQRLPDLRHLITVDSWLADIRNDQQTQDTYRSQALRLRTYACLSVWQMDVMAAALLLRQWGADFIYVDVTYSTRWLRRHIPLLIQGAHSQGIIAGSGRQKMRIRELLDEVVETHGGQLEQSRGSLWIWNLAGSGRNP